MPDRISAGGPKVTPIERIFKKVMRRKMTAEERSAFHLKALPDIDLTDGDNSAGLPHTSGPMVRTARAGQN